VARYEKNFMRPYNGCIKCGCFLFWVDKEEGHVFRSPVRARQRINDAGKQDDQVFNINDMKEIKVQLGSMYLGMIEGMKEWKATLGRIYDAVRIVLLLWMRIFFVFCCSSSY